MSFDRQRLESLLRKLRQRVFDYYEESEAKGQKCSRLIVKVKARLEKLPLKSKGQTWDCVLEQVDQWGATARDRALLARNGMAWGD